METEKRRRNETAEEAVVIGWKINMCCKYVRARGEKSILEPRGLKEDGIAGTRKGEAHILLVLKYDKKQAKKEKEKKKEKVKGNDK